MTIRAFGGRGGSDSADQGHADYHEGYHRTDFGNLEGISPRAGGTLFGSDRPANQVGGVIWLGQLDGIIASLNSKRLILVARPDTDPFWISDNPVVMWNAFPYGILGVAQRGIEIYMPISPEYCLGFWCPSIELKMSQLLAARPTEIVRQQVLAILEGIQAGKPVLTLAADTLKHLNSLQVTYSSRFVYGPSDNFSLAREIVAGQPEIRDVQSQDGGTHGPRAST